jgi:hypothetical protein
MTPRGGVKPVRKRNSLNSLPESSGTSVSVSRAAIALCKTHCRRSSLLTAVSKSSHQSANPCDSLKLDPHGNRRSRPWPLNGCRVHGPSTRQARPQFFPLRVPFPSVENPEWGSLTRTNCMRQS